MRVAASRSVWELQKLQKPQKLDTSLQRGGAHRVFDIDA